MSKPIHSHRYNKPTLSDFKTSVFKLLGEEGQQIWNSTLKKLGLNEDSSDISVELMEELIQTIIDQGDLLSIVGRSYMIRMKTYKMLAKKEEVSHDEPK